MRTVTKSFFEENDMNHVSRFIDSNLVQNKFGELLLIDSNIHYGKYEQRVEYIIPIYIRDEENVIKVYGIFGSEIVYDIIVSNGNVDFPQGKTIHDVNHRFINKYPLLKTYINLIYSASNVNRYFKIFEYDKIKDVLKTLKVAKLYKYQDQGFIITDENIIYEFVYDSYLKLDIEPIILNKTDMIVVNENVINMDNNGNMIVSHILTILYKQKYLRSDKQHLIDFYSKYSKQHTYLKIFREND